MPVERRSASGARSRSRVDNRVVSASIAPRRRRSWLSIACWLAAATLFIVGLLSERHGVWWVLAGIALAPLLIALARRSKAAKAPGATFASSADLLPVGAGGATVAGELSVAPAGLTWIPGMHAARDGHVPITLASGDCESASMQAGPTLLDVVLTVRSRSGEEWRFLTHRSRGLRSGRTARQRRVPGLSRGGTQRKRSVQAPISQRRREDPSYHR